MVPVWLAICSAMGAIAGGVAEMNDFGLSIRGLRMEPQRGDPVSRKVHHVAAPDFRLSRNHG